MEPANLQAFVTRASDSELYVHRSCICICIIDEHVAKLYLTATRVPVVKKEKKGRELFKENVAFFFRFLHFISTIYSCMVDRKWMCIYVCMYTSLSKFLMG